MSYTCVVTAWTDCNGNGIFDAGVDAESAANGPTTAVAQQVCPAPDYRTLTAFGVGLRADAESSLVLFTMTAGITAGPVGLTRLLSRPMRAWHAAP